MSATPDCIAILPDFNANGVLYLTFVFKQSRETNFFQPQASSILSDPTSNIFSHHHIISPTTISILIVIIIIDLLILPTSSTDHIPIPNRQAIVPIIITPPLTTIILPTDPIQLTNITTTDEPPQLHQSNYLANWTRLSLISNISNNHLFPYISNHQISSIV